MSLIVPAFVAVGIAVLAGLLPLPLRPSVAAQVLGALAVVAAAITFVGLVVLSFVFLAGPTVVGAIAQWCPAVSLHHRLSWPLGTTAVALLGAVMWRIRCVVERQRVSGCDTRGLRLAVLDVEEPIAYAAPGSPGCVVVSAGLLAALEPRERQVVFAHERAHLEQRHHRYLFAMALATAVLPLLGPVARRVRHATERCADEAAVEAMGGDRELVASAIARAALASTSHRRLVASFGGGSVPARVGALLGGQLSPRRIVVGLLVATSTVALVAGVSAVQVFRLAEFVGHVCGR